LPARRPSGRTWAAPPGNVWRAGSDDEQASNDRLRRRAYHVVVGRLLQQRQPVREALDQARALAWRQVEWLDGLIERS
jgi:hypothetical protein